MAAMDGIDHLLRDVHKVLVAASAMPSTRSIDNNIPFE
jgi:hypothetical protein